MKGLWAWMGASLLVVALMISLVFVLITAGKSEPLQSLIVKDLPLLGDAVAPHEIILVTDFACPACKRYHAEMLPKVMKRFVDNGSAKLRVLAFPIREGSTDLARAVMCLQQQPGTDVKDLYDYIYGADFSSIDNEELSKRLVSQLRPTLTEDALKACIRHPDTLKWVEAQRYRAIVHGITSVPTIVIDRTLLTDAWKLADYEIAMNNPTHGAQ